LEALADKTALTWGGIEKLEFHLLRRRVEANLRGMAEFAYESLLQGDDRRLYDRHFAQALATQWYGLCFGRERGLTSEQTILASVVGLEALFGEERKGKKDYVRSRPAQLLGRDLGEIARITEEADRLYRLRNAVVHSGGFTREYRGPVAAAELLRCCLGLHAILVAAEGLTRSEINTALDQSKGPELRETIRRYLGSDEVLNQFAPALA
jgi:hypothetical protein